MTKEVVKKHKTIWKKFLSFFEICELRKQKTNKEKYFKSKIQIIDIQI